MSEEPLQITIVDGELSQLTTGAWRVPITVPNHFHLAAKNLAMAMELTETEVLYRLLEVAMHLIAASHRSARANRRVPQEWLPFVLALDRARAAEDAARAAEEKAKEKRRERDKVRYLNEKLQSIDVTKLEKDGRNPTGWKNVYRYSAGYRAMVCRDGKARYLPTRSDAILAAQDRLEWYQRYGLPYGVEEKVLASNPMSQTDPDLHLAVARDTDDYMTGRGGFTATSLQDHLDAIKVKREIAAAEDAKRGRGRPRKVKDVRARQAGVVTWLDEQRVVIEHPDGTALSYMPIKRVTVWMGDVIERDGKLGEIDGANARVLVHDVPPPSSIRGRTKPQPKHVPLAEGAYLEIPTAAERKALSAPAPDQADDVAKKNLIALIRKQKAEIAKTPTERISEQIERENESRESIEEEVPLFVMPTEGEDDYDAMIESMVDDAIMATEPEPRTVIPIRPIAPARPAPQRPPSAESSDDDFFSPKG